MFRNPAWRVANISKAGGHLRVTVPAPDDIGEKVVTLLIAGFMTWGFIYLFVYDGIMQIHTVSALLPQCLLALLFGVPFFFVLRELLEKAFALQEVEVNEEMLVWSRRTKLWSRRHQLILTDITDIVPDTPTFGEHGVRVIRSGGGRPKVLQGLSTESAREASRALKRCVKG